MVNDNSTVKDLNYILKNMSQAYFLGRKSNCYLRRVPFIIKICENPENLSERSSGYCEKYLYPILVLKWIYFSF
jgi:hypothetical protein